jgi:hypothetical protein
MSPEIIRAHCIFQEVPMQFEDANIQNLISEFKAFSVEGFNIFGTGQDNLPHVVCVCSNKQFARAIQSLLTTARRAQTLQVVAAEINSNCYLTPMLLADGKLALVASVIDDAVWKDGNEVEYDGLELQLGSPEYENLVSHFVVMHPSEPTLHVYEDSLTDPIDPKDEFPF